MDIINIVFGAILIILSLVGLVLIHKLYTHESGEEVVQLKVQLYEQMQQNDTLMEERQVLQNTVQELTQQTKRASIVSDVLGDTIATLQDTIAGFFTSEKGKWKSSEGMATAYSPYDNQSGIEADGDPSTTSTGVAPGPHIMAVDPKRIPYGSTILVVFPDGSCIQGIAGDTGGALRRNKRLQVDIYKETYKETVNFGVQDVIILWKTNE